MRFQWQKPPNTGENFFISMETATFLHISRPNLPFSHPPSILHRQSPSQIRNSPFRFPKLCKNPNKFLLPELNSTDLLNSNPRRVFSPALNCLGSKNSYENQNAQSKVLENPLETANFWKNWLFSTISQATTFDICKWVGVFSLLIAATKTIFRLLLNPFFWMYFSWTWLFWPWFIAISIGVYGIYAAFKHSKGIASIFEQLIVISSAFTWLTLVPPAHFNGFLEGWPVVFFFVYHYFFFFNVSVRKRLYGDLYPRAHDPKWDIDLPASFKLLFFAAVMAGHWFAAFEAPPLHQIPGGWSNFVIWIVIMLVLFMQYHGVLYLSNYSEKIKVPTSVVQFGPYRWVRHPIYASTMFLFATYCAALRAPLSLLFIVSACILYYEQKAKLEEDLMVQTFGESYTAYKNKVRYKFIPSVY